MKKNVKELREMLLNKEMSFIELDNILAISGYYTVFDDGATENIKNDLNVVYTATDTKEAEVQISFVITADNGPDEIEESFYLRVTDIQEF